MSIAFLVFSFDCFLLREFLSNIKQVVQFFK